MLRNFVFLFLMGLKKEKVDKSEARRKSSNAKSIYKQLSLLYLWLIIDFTFKGKNYF